MLRVESSIHKLVWAIMCGCNGNAVAMGWVVNMINARSPAGNN